jgi:hypothetical protein
MTVFAVHSDLQVANQIQRTLIHLFQQFTWLAGVRTPASERVYDIT